MQLLDMPCDVLEDILSHCSKPSRLALSLTSSKSNVLAAPYLLHNVHITCSPSHILSFVNYIIDHTQVHGGRGKNMDLSGAGVHIKILVIAYRAFFVDGERGAPSPTWASRLTQALALMPNLRAITLAYQVDEITASSSAFCGMLMSRPHLRSINLSSVDESAAEQLWEAMKTRHGQMNLQKVAVELKRQMEVTPIVGRGVGNILFYSRNSLTEVCLANCALVDFLCTENRSTSLVFPKVTSLSLTSCTAKATALAHSFPNVQVFTIFNSHLTDVTCPQTCSAAQRGYPTLFPQISSLEGDEPDVTRFLQSDGPYQSCRRVVIDSQWDYPGKYVGDAAPNFSVLDVVPSLRSFHFYLWDVSPTESWWQELVQSAPQLVFLKASVRIQTVSQLDLSVSSLTYMGDELLKFPQ